MTEDQWNKAFEVGQTIELTEDDGSITYTVTRSYAWDLCGTPVIKVDGKTGGYMLDRIRAV